MSIKDAVIIAAITCGIIGGAVTGIVGGACGMAAAATALHLVVDNGH
ncbi:MAG: hypothetical protein KF802_05415 [Bdellovibrionaceae bacterium]|nr:hypothetical protein [Pseudobdellovibrionaceae bacterium]MBX3032348.1 hypothetical protein [Pseudobdellovibrionaceae bacterium]